MEDTSGSHPDDQLGNPIMQVQILSLAHLLYKARYPVNSECGDTVVTDKDKAPKSENEKPSDDFRSFDEAASKLFKVPVEEIRELEEKEDKHKS